MATEVYDKLDWYEDADVLAAKTKQMNILAQWSFDHRLVDDYVLDYCKPPVD
jgi:hypothetical protein